MNATAAEPRRGRSNSWASIDVHTKGENSFVMCAISFRDCSLLTAAENQQPKIVAIFIRSHVSLHIGAQEAQTKAPIQAESHDDQVRRGREYREEGESDGKV